MNNFIFENSTKVYFGRGSVKEFLADKIKTYAGAVMLAYGGGSVKKNGIYDEVRQILVGEGKEIVEFSGIMPNPTYQKVLEGASLVRAHHVGLILGVGGGSVMDCCKAVSMAAVYDGDLWSDYWEKRGVVYFDPIPLGVIVTAAGTGSEMNGGAVITNQDKKIKTGMDYPECNPKFALMDPEYTMSVPKIQTASGGFDILSHIMETYFSCPDEDNVSDDIAEALMKSVVKNLPKAIENPEDYTARSNLMWASSMAENRIIKLGKRTDFQAHQIEHQIGVYTDCNHGCGLAVIQPVYYRYIYKENPKKFARFAQNVWDISSDGKKECALALEGIQALERFIAEIGLPTTLKELGIDNKALLSEIAASCNISRGSYKHMTEKDILTILNESY